MVMMENDKDLEALFAEAKNAPRPAPDNVMARVLVDAERVQRELQSPVVAAPRKARSSIWDFIGGWTGAVSFAACAAAGLYVGYIGIDASLFGLTNGVVGDTLFQELDLIFEGI